MKKKGIWIPVELMQDSKLDWPDRVLLAEIYSLSKLENGCIASNQFFGDLLGIGKSAASKRITKLVKGGYIKCTNHYKDNQCIGRVIVQGNSQRNNTVVPSEQGGGSCKSKEVVPKDPEPSSEGKPINTSTNSGILKQIPIHKSGSSQDKASSKTEPVTLDVKFKEQYNEAAGFLYDATSIGEKIFSYIDSKDFNELKSIIGEKEYDRIEHQIKKYIQSCTMLGY